MDKNGININLKYKQSYYHGEIKIYNNRKNLKGKSFNNVDCLGINDCGHIKVTKARMEIATINYSKNPRVRTYFFSSLAKQVLIFWSISWQFTFFYFFVLRQRVNISNLKIKLWLKKLP